MRVRAVSTAEVAGESRCIPGDVEERARSSAIQDRNANHQPETYSSNPGDSRLGNVSTPSSPLRTVGAPARQLHMPDAPAVDVASILTIGNVTIRLNPAEGWERAISGNATHLVFLDGARITDPREALAAIYEAALSAGKASK